MSNIVCYNIPKELQEDLNRSAHHSEISRSRWICQAIREKLQREAAVKKATMEEDNHHGGGTTEPTQSEQLKNRTP